MLLFGLAGVIGAGLAGWAVARNGLRPVRRLTAAVEQIARTEDLRPLPVEGDDEIARLATAFNQMLTALAASRDRQRQLVADAGHELRTPLTSLRTNIDLLTQADSEGGLPAQARAELLADVRAQIEELTTLIGDLVELARDEPLPARRRARSSCRARSSQPSPGSGAGRPAITFEVRGRALVRRSGERTPVSSARSPTCSTTPPSGARRAGPSRSASPTASAHRRRRGPRHRRGRPAARLRALLPLPGVPVDARLRARALDRRPGRRAALRHRRGRPGADRRRPADCYGCPVPRSPAPAAAAGRTRRAARTARSVLCTAVTDRLRAAAVTSPA